ncbi:MAG: HAD-IIIA family hydrolase [Bacteroidia bacterium]|nr:HAD-IIIA family hydrolase [Bacteroidia bacterium]
MDYLKKNLQWLIEKGRLDSGKLAADLSLPTSSIVKADVRYIENWLRIAELSGFSLDILAHIDLSARDMASGKGIKLLTLDVDGVMTEGGMFYSEDGNEYKRFNTRDGIGIRLALAAGVKVGFISHGKNNGLISSRAKHLGVDLVYTGKDSKLGIIGEWAKQAGLGLEACAHVGDDINDLEVMDKVGLSACPADAVDIMKKHARVVLRKKGGEGCVREFIESYLV